MRDESHFEFSVVKRGTEKWVRTRGRSLPGAVEMRLAKGEDGRLVCTGLVIGLKEAEREITATDLRRIPLAQLVNEFAMQAPKSPETARFLSNIFGGTVSLSATGVGFSAGTARLTVRPGPKGYPREHFQRIAKAYRQALALSPRAPLKTLAARLHLSESTARRWVRRARDMGFLRESTPGRAGETPEA